MHYGPVESIYRFLQATPLLVYNLNWCLWKYHPLLGSCMAWGLGSTGSLQCALANSEKIHKQDP
jgi:hypothetical protein